MRWSGTELRAADPGLPLDPGALKATAGFLLTIGATFGATVTIFQWGWLSELVGLDTSGPLVSFLPIILIGILFGLAMDYEVFLVSRMREDFVHGETAAEAVVSGSVTVPGSWSRPR